MKMPSGPAIIIFGVIYTLGVLVFAFITAGAGEGTMLLAIPLLSSVFPLACLEIVRKPRTKADHWVFGLLMGLHYLITVVATYKVELHENGLYYFERYVQHDVTIVVVGTIWYLVGQLVIWSWFRMSLHAFNFK